jgi:hypothetical protein
MAAVFFTRLLLAGRLQHTPARVFGIAALEGWLLTAGALAGVSMSLALSGAAGFAMALFRAGPRARGATTETSLRTRQAEASRGRAWAWAIDT